jgi:hypothetical protein
MPSTRVTNNNANAASRETMQEKRAFIANLHDQLGHAHGILCPSINAQCLLKAEQEGQQERRGDTRGRAFAVTCIVSDFGPV